MMPEVFGNLPNDKRIFMVHFKNGLPIFIKYPFSFYRISFFVPFLLFVYC